MFPADGLVPLPVAVPLDRGIPSYLSVDDLRTSPYVCNVWHRQNVQTLDRGRTFITHDPETSSLLPFAYVIYYDNQADPTNPPNRSLLLTAASHVTWRGDLLIVRLDTRQNTLPVRRSIPCQLDARDRPAVTRILARYAPRLYHALLFAYGHTPVRSSTTSCLYLLQFELLRLFQY